MFGKKKKDDDNTSPSQKNQSLTALMRGIQHAASSTQTIISQQYMQMLNQFFEEKDDKLYAKMIYVQVDDQHWMPVPLISMIAPQGISLKRMKIDLSIQINEAELKAATIDSDKKNIDRLGFKVSLSPPSDGKDKRRPNVTNLELEFESAPAPEGLSKLIDSFTNMIQPLNEKEYQIPTKTHPGTSIKYTNKIKKDQGES